MADLSKMGWNEYFEEQLSPIEKQHSAIARIVEPLRGLSRAVWRLGEVWAECTEKATSGSRLVVPAIGDWIVGSPRSFGAGEVRISIDRILKRRNQLSRSAPGGKGYEQVLCANADVAFIVIALTQELNLSAIKRYLEILKESGLSAAIVVTKVDEASDSLPVLQAIREVAPEVPLHPISVKDHRGLDALPPYFAQSKTVVLLGASGAGKSTLVNHLTGKTTQRVEEVRESDQKGRHTTTGRRLYLLPEGGMVIDSPGIREIQRWEAPEEASKPSPKNKKIQKSHKHSRSRREAEDED